MLASFPPFNGIDLRSQCRFFNRLLVTQPLVIALSAQVVEFFADFIHFFGAFARTFDFSLGSGFNLLGFFLESLFVLR